MQQIKSYLRQQLNSDAFLPFVLILVLWVVIVMTNIPLRGQFLIGWDNLFPEFNFWVNIKRALFGVWQENQGLGHIGGHGYAATLFHSLLLWVGSFILPLELLRSSFTLCMLLVGALGCFFFTRLLLRNLPVKLQNVAGIIASFYYMLNLGTIQNFYMTDVISRHSITMAKCTQEILGCRSS